MSVPHLDTRIVDGKPSLLFGPFAGINPKFLKEGSVLDLPRSIRMKNILPYISVALKNFDLLIYLIREITKSKAAKFAQLREFVPNAEAKDWTYYEAGQRTQIIKPKGKLGELQFGTEVISSADGSIAGLLGASPGASVSVSAMLDVMQHMFPTELRAFTQGELAATVTGYGGGLNSDSVAVRKHLRATSRVLGLRA